jgi:signal transduction histidine kinase
MRRRVFRWLLASTVVVAAITASLLHGASARAPFSRHPWWLVLCALPIIGAASSIIARRLARPLEQLARFADQLSAGDLSARLPVGRELDLRVVQTAFNRMADRIAQQLADQRALLGAVSHELRSPLQRMKIEVELLRKGDLTPLSKLEREIQEMDQLVGDLLAGARMDFGALKRDTIDAAELALAALERLEEAPEKLNVETPGLVIRADPTLAQRALLNLVENARRHGGGLKELRVSGVGGSVRFAALDDGPGFAGDEVDRIFLPFQQTSTATSVGLGLSLVRRIAEAHGGRAFAENRPEGGALVAVELPSVA